MEFSRETGFQPHLELVVFPEYVFGFWAQMTMVPPATELGNGVFISHLLPKLQEDL